mmetsp:Transcript_22268/g.58031  ORF Transcript_22268/g.58031 Transcript_22268/m.58031 type:complete len:330 (-) Transcript_22268:1548-2537(-)
MRCTASPTSMRDSSPLRLVKSQFSDTSIKPPTELKLPRPFRSLMPSLDSTKFIPMLVSPESGARSVTMGLATIATSPWTAFSCDRPSTSLRPMFQKKCACKPTSCRLASPEVLERLGLSKTTSPPPTRFRDANAARDSSFRLLLMVMRQFTSSRPSRPVKSFSSGLLEIHTSDPIFLRPPGCVLANLLPMALVLMKSDRTEVAATVATSGPNPFRLFIRGQNDTVSEPLTSVMCNIPSRLFSWLPPTMPSEPTDFKESRPQKSFSPDWFKSELIDTPPKYTKLPVTSVMWYKVEDRDCSVPSSQITTWPLITPPSFVLTAFPEGANRAF